MEPIITVDRVIKRFGRVRALDGLSLTIPAGVIYGLLGPNGAGKTTLIRILATLLSTDAGVVRIAGFDVRGNPDAVRARIGLAGQHAALDNHLTGRENTEMVGRLHGLSRHDARARTSSVLEAPKGSTAANCQYACRPRVAWGLHRSSMPGVGTGASVRCRPATAAQVRGA